MSEPCASVVHWICAGSATLALISIAVSVTHLRWVAQHIARHRREEAAMLRRLGETRISFSDETQATDRQALLPPAQR